MKLKIHCEVDSESFIGQETQIDRPDRTYIFHSNEKGLLNKITIIGDVPRPEEFYSEIRGHTFIIGKDDEFYNSLIREFQGIESLMSPLFGMRKVYWENAEYSVIPETEEEELKTKIIGWNTKRKNEPDIVHVSESQLGVILDDRVKCEKLIDPLSFYREGKLDLESRRYINAYYNFYFVLEGLYGNQKTKNKDIAQEFKNSKGLTKAVDIAVNKILDAKLKQSISDLVTQKKRQFDVEGIIDLLVLTRGELHHFTNNPKRLQATPFNHEKFQDITHFIMVIAFLVSVSYFALERDDN